jgi:hypothetical protein
MYCDSASPCNGTCCKSQGSGFPACCLSFPLCWPLPTEIACGLPGGDCALCPSPGPGCNTSTGQCN